MPEIPQITNPITSKSYNYTSRPTDAATAPFDIVSLTQTGSVSASSAESGRARAQLSMGQKDLIPLSVQVAKDPTLAVKVLKDLLNVEVLNQTLINGHTELHGELEDLAKALYLSPDRLVDEIQGQEQQSTMFSGDEFYNILRDLAKTTTSADTKELVGNVLKSLNFAQNKSEILNALAANMKFLSEYFSPNQKLSKQLSDLAAQWSAQDAGDYYELLKTQTLSILKDVSGSLLNDDKTQTLIPLIVHNLSRYNQNSYMLKESFSLLMTQITSTTLAEALQNAYNRLLNKIFTPSELGDYQNAEGPLSNNTPNAAQNQAEIADSETKNTINKLSAFFSENLANSDYLSSLEIDESAFDKLFKAYFSGRETGLNTIKNSFQLLLGGSGGRKMMPVLISEFKSLDNMNSLITYLNDVLQNMPDIPLRQELYKNYVKIVEQMALKNEMPPNEGRPPINSALVNLTDFIKENINHPALKSLDSFNAANLLQSLLNAPGVFTPLAHYIIPLDVGGTKAFGELWVDNDENNPNNTPETQRNYHLFLTFDVDSVGRFELDMYALGEDISMTLLYPAAFSKKAEEIKEQAGRVIAGIGYRTKSFDMAVLKSPHNLTEIFPKIMDRRTTLDKRI